MVTLKPTASITVVSQLVCGRTVAHLRGGDNICSYEEHLKYDSNE